ncbi:MAG: hypothetical protein ABIO70_33020 [Pseudomonadota bacterium]
MTFRRVQALTALLLAGLVLPFLGKPVHVDDANFLALAAGARADWWRPHDVVINWQGHAERAFDVLSNPPGVAWWLAPVVHAPVAVQHLWMLPWLVLAAWGAARLGRRFGGAGSPAVLLVLASPFAVLAAQALTPDLPLLALTLAGMGGFIAATDARRPGVAAGWAVVAGGPLLFRYSGLALLPLLLLYPLLHRRPPWPALAGLAPLALLVLHDLSAYGQVHLLAMAGFQSTAGSGWETFRKGAAALAMLGGAGLFPLLAIRGGRWSAGLALLGALVGVIAARGSGLPPGATTWTVACCAGGGALYGALARGEDRVDRVFLGAWALGGLAFLLTLRFTAGRYWLPFLPALALAWLRLRPPRALLAVTLGLQAALALLLAVDDQAQAQADLQAARDVQAAAVGLDGPRAYAGHWGWQHALERAGWSAIEDEAPLSAGTLLAVAAAPWPQRPAEGTCLEPLWERGYRARWPGPRVHTAAGRANLHAFLVAGEPPLETYVPWSFADDDREHATLYRVCP